MDIVIICFFKIPNNYKLKSNFSLRKIEKSGLPSSGAAPTKSRALLPT